jgi:hypothetical protein
MILWASERLNRIDLFYLLKPVFTVVHSRFVAGVEKLVHKQSVGQVFYQVFKVLTFSRATSFNKTFCISFIWA